MATTDTALIRVINGKIEQAGEFQLALAEIKRDVEAIEAVCDQPSYALAREVVARARVKIKEIEAAAEPERLRLQNALNELRSQRNKLTALFETEIAAIDKQSREWNLNIESAAAKAEQDRYNKGKRAEDRITVKPNIPAAPPSGRVIAHYEVEVVNISKVNRAFLMPNFVKMREQARDDKDPKATERKIGGVRVTRS